MNDKNIPEGFIALDRDSPFSDLTGPYVSVRWTPIDFQMNNALM